MTVVMLELQNQFDKIVVLIVAFVVTQIIDCYNVRLA